jgi:hypothetical protein
MSMAGKIIISINLSKKTNLDKLRTQSLIFLAKGQKIGHNSIKAESSRKKARDKGEGLSFYRRRLWTTVGCFYLFSWGLPSLSA